MAAIDSVLRRCRCVPRVLSVPVHPLLPLGSAQAGAIDVIGFPEARAEDPAAIYCLSAVRRHESQTRK